MLSAGRPSFPAPPSLSAQSIPIQGSIPSQLKDNPSHLKSHQPVPILVDESLVDSPSWETRLMLGQRGPLLECRNLTDPALLPALCITARWKRTKQPRTRCFCQNRVALLYSKKHRLRMYSIPVGTGSRDTRRAWAEASPEKCRCPVKRHRR